MKTIFGLILSLTILLFSFSSCELNELEPIIDPDPGIDTTAWNGIEINGLKYPTPNAVIEIWGNNIDSLSSDYDISFTDGTFDSESRQIVDNSILVYFDANSPSLDDLSAGTYHIEKTNARKPGNIVDAYILIHYAGSVIKYSILSGAVTVTEDEGRYIIDYTLETVVDSEIIRVSGQFGGIYTIVDQTTL